METVKQIFEELQTTNSKLDKERILTINKNNELLKSVLKFVYNPFILTGLSTKKINKSVSTNQTKNINTFYEAVDYLTNHNTGTDEDIANIQNFIHHDKHMAEFYKDIFTKSVRLGCDTKTFNKVWGKDFIPEHDVQQAYSIDKYKLKDNEWFSLSEKLNGIRGSYVDGKILSRQGHEISGLEHIIDDIEKLGLSNMFIDGELKRINIDDVSDNENFRLTASIINTDDNDKSEIQFTIFDILPKDEFCDGESCLKYKARLEMMLRIKDNISKLNIHNLRFVDILYSGTDQSKIDEYLDLMVQQDKEGLMLNRDTIYKCKRNNGILKIKRFYTIDLKIIGVEEGSGRLKNTLGALVVDFKGNSVNVGSGYDDEARKRIWADKENIIGKIIEVKYKEISSDKTGRESLQFPIFVCIRNDKDVISYD